MLTATGFVVSSVLCMPPEQARGEHQLDRPADVYALGAVLPFAATGHYPYKGPTWQAVALKIKEMRAAHAYISARLQQAVNKGSGHRLPSERQRPATDGSGTGRAGQPWAA